MSGHKIFYLILDILLIYFFSEFRLLNRFSFHKIATSQSREFIRISCTDLDIPLSKIKVNLLPLFASCHETIKENERRRDFSETKQN